GGTVRGWRSPVSSLTILAMLFWLGTAMAPTITSTSGGGTTGPIDRAIVEAPDRSTRDEPELLPWPQDYCAGGCPSVFDEPSLESDIWKPVLEAAATTTSSSPTRSAARVVTPGSAAAPPPAPRPVEEWRSLVSAYFAPEHVELALRIISCESGGDPNAQNPRSGAAGLFQQIPRYWEARAAAAGVPGASIFDPIANVAVSAQLAYSEGWNHWAASAGCWQ
ncbi:MAG: transglycosylase SLT domain-containing protein, partial [Acidimicrobiia bacterium]